VLELGRPYKAEMAELERTFAYARAIDLGPLRAAIAYVANPLVAIGSGGALAAAHLLAQLHEDSTGLTARVATPLDVAARSRRSRSTAVLITASGRHPDALGAISRIKELFETSAVIATNPADALRHAADRAGVQLVELGNPSGKDGFLATNSLLVQTTAFVRCYTEGSPPEALPALGTPAPSAIETSEVLVLNSPDLHAVAIDLEARLNEVGLAAVQATDYRNFGHGRHYGLARRSDRTTVISVTGAGYEPLAEATLALLPPDVGVIRLSSTLHWPWSVVDLLAASMRLIGATGAAQGLDPGRPRVQSFGRRLYRLSTRRLLEPTPLHTPVDYKLSELGSGRASPDLRARYATEYDTWREELASARFGGLVLDYDGTVVTTADRFNPPTTAVSDELLRILSEGATVGFASGRGSSLHEALRAVLPRKLWGHVTLGLYTGAVLLRLDEAVPENPDPPPELEAAGRRIAGLPIASEIITKMGGHQIRVEPRHRQRLPVSGLANVLESVLRAPPSLAVTIAASAHSVDVRLSNASKLLVVDALSVESGDVLSMGDQGHFGGNDFELLARSKMTLSVDRCSPDPTRCWRLTRPADAGPRGLVQYLRALKHRRAGFAFVGKLGG
jgi:hypothetical protein